MYEKYFLIVPQSKIRLSMPVEQVENRVFYPRQESDTREIVAFRPSSM